MLDRWRFSHVQKRFLRFGQRLIIAWGFVMLLGLPLLAQSTSVTQATITQIVGNQVFIRAQPARIRDIARTGEQVRTTQARTQLTFNTGALGRLGPNSALTVGQQCFQIQQGEILVSGAANGCSSTVRAGVRGTTYYMDINEQGDTHVRVLEGEVEVSPMTQRRTQPVRLAQGQGIIVQRDGRFSPVRQMPQTSYDEILTGPLVEGFDADLPNLARLRQAYETLFPGAVFPLAPRENRQGWDTRLQMARMADFGQEATGIRLQLEVFDKPLTRYANAVYQLYARQDRQWVQVYSNRGARLIPNASGGVTLPPEDVAFSQMWLGRLGREVRLSDLELQGVVLLRYDLPNGDRDLKLELATTQFYSELPLATQF
ncbi:MULTISPECIES: FecR domain-containing protein [Desertifilum]|uniref:FecR protein domain-containing protein n=2 Tax=Desertifilum TaxID=1185872 RepID=A0A1E5QQP6_9CYAN|nr:MULTISPECIES: FecR domain-containing protein [Desertifilum]MBD2323309.1 FecR domain-containing protein [Desertifilum sp. FACHB-866]MBD2333154.1 FecR domain-containing protein [Desertifilum sp. FACHB-868]MDA0213470.1 FecR domain-containing protein [Cyanobacteria bacterium FC1]OEJ76982.1 hypothetical protein BH720_01985 [Desertifilum tharense IPPAS B-1220]